MNGKGDQGKTDRIKASLMIPLPDDKGVNIEYIIHEFAKKSMAGFAKCYYVYKVDSYKYFK